MKRKRTSFIILALAALSLAVLILLTRRDPLAHAQRMILLSDPARVDSVVLSGKHETVRLHIQGGAWKAGGEAVNQVAVENLLYAAGHLRISSPYGMEMTDTLPPAVRVSFFSKGEQLRSYRVQNAGGQFLIIPDGAGNAYRMELPGYAGLDLGRVFTSRLSHYLEHRLIDLLPSEIRYVEVTRKGEETYRISMDENGTFSCAFPGTDSILDPELLDDLAVRLLFSYFTNIRYERRLDTASSATAEFLVPDRFLARLTVAPRKGGAHTLGIFSMPADEGPGNHMYKAVVRYNEDPVPLVVNYIYLDVLMRPLVAYYVDKG